MKKLYVLCCLTIAAVVLDIALFHSRSVNAQNVPPLRIHRVIWEAGRTGVEVPGTLGHIVGFHCIQGQATAECFVASAAN